MAIALDASTSGVGLNTFSFGPIDTSSNSDSLLILAQSGFDATGGAQGVPSDSQSNTYTSLTSSHPANNNQTRINYKYSPSNSATMSFTLTGSIIAEYGMAGGFTGVQTSSDPFDQQSVAFSAGATTLQAGSITPSTDGQLIIATVIWPADLGSSVAIDSGFTIISQTPNAPGNNVGGAWAYLIQGTAGAINPQWSGTNGVLAGAAIASFKAAAVAGGFGPIIMGGSIAGQGIVRGRLVTR